MVTRRQFLRGAVAAAVVASTGVKPEPTMYHETTALAYAPPIGHSFGASSSLGPMTRAQYREQLAEGLNAVFHAQYHGYDEEWHELFGHLDEEMKA